jgi:hypothetical protein
MGTSMLGMPEFILICVALLGLMLLIYCVGLLRRIDRATTAIRFLLFRDYEDDIRDRGQRPLLKQAPEPPTPLSRSQRN